MISKEKSDLKDGVFNQIWKKRTYNLCTKTNSFRNRKKGIIKIDNFLDINEIKKISKIIKYYSAPKNTPESYFPTNFKAMGLKILNLNFIKFFHSLEILKISKKKLEDLANEFFKNKSELRFIDAYYSKISIKDVLPWHTDQAILEKNT